MVRSIFSVVAGFVVLVGLTAGLWAAFGVTDPTDVSSAFVLFSVVCEVVFALGAGLLTAWIAGRHGGRHAAYLAAVVVLQGLAQAVFGGAELPLWVPLSTVLLVAPCCFLGGLIRPRNTPPGASPLAGEEPTAGSGDLVGG
jgi:hypothetical protein